MGNLTALAGTIQLNEGNFYTVTGTLGSPTSSSLILKSSSLGTASLLHTTLSVPATCERYLSANNWHFIFSPLDNANISILTTTSTGLTNPNFYYYDETVEDFWLGATLYDPTGWTTPSYTDKLLTDRGYIHQSDESYAYRLTGGSLFTGQKDFTLTYSGTQSGTEPTTSLDWTYFKGWNFVGNPYPSAIDWTAIPLANKANIENFIYYYDDSQDKYLCYGASEPWNYTGDITINGANQYIPANQGFFVKALPTATPVTLSIPDAARRHSGQALWKKASQQTSPNIVRLQVEQGKYTDEIVVRTLEPATLEHDPQFDAYKRFSWNPDRPQLYSRNMENTFQCAVNTIPNIVEHTTVPLGVYVGVAGTYSLRFTENSFENVHVWLEDNGTEVNIAQNPVYTFTQGAETNESRFILHFGYNHAPTALGQIPDQETPQNELYSYTAPSGLFSDPDFSDVLTLSATLADGSALPEWLSFDPATGIFSGTPADVQSLDIMLTATDKFGKTASDVFVLSVLSSTTPVNTIATSSVAVFPNPTDGKLYVSVGGQERIHAVVVTDVFGKVIKSMLVSSQNAILDFGSEAAGVYFIKVKTDTRETVHRIVKK
jgi:hypothetical protein